MSEASGVEVAAAEKWLAKRGVRVSPPTRLIALRLGARGRLGKEMIPWVGVATMVGLACSFSYRFVPGIDLPVVGSWYFYYTFVAVALVVAMWRVDRPVRWAARPASSSRLKLIGGWYLTSVVITFLGGAVLGALMVLHSENPADRDYLRGWLGSLAVGFVGVVVVMISVVLGPELAADEASLAVDDALRVESTYVIVPALFAVPVPLDFMFDDRQPPGFAVWLIVYAVLVLVVQVIGFVKFRRRYRTLPPGNYGVPSPG